MKKYIISLSIILLSSIIIFSSQSFAQEDTEFFYQTQEGQTNALQDDTTDLAKLVKTDALKIENSLSDRISKLMGIDQYITQDAPALAYIKVIINRLLGLVSFIALVVTIFAFYQILGGKGEEGVTKAKKMLTGVAIALAIMGLSWIIVSYFYSLYATVTPSI